MPLKPRYKRRIFWTIVSAICALALAVVIIPPMITLNGLKPMIEKAIQEQMNVPAKINGNIHFSLIGGATIVAHDVVVPTATIGSVMLSIPIHDFFDMKNAKLKKSVSIYDANIHIENITPASFNHDIKIYNSKINFKDRDFKIVRAQFHDNKFYGVVRTKNHKYEINFFNDRFEIKNNNNDLDITGQIYSDNSIRGHLSLKTNNINDWFDFPDLYTHHPIELTMNFEWDNTNTYKFKNIETEYFSGNVDILPNGDKNIQIVSNDIQYDFSFLLTPTQQTNTTNINIDFYGDLKFKSYNFKHIKINARLTPKSLQINNLIADDIAITGGTITENGAQDLMITMPYNGTDAMCLFSGTPNKWQCSKYSYGNIFGTISVNDNNFNIIAQSQSPFSTSKDLMQLIDNIGTSGTISFSFSDIGGTYKITNKIISETKYNYAVNKTLNWLGIQMPLLPDFFKNTAGNLDTQNGMLTFVPNDKTWQLSTYDNYFNLSGTSFKSWFPKIDLQSLIDNSYTISGFFKNHNIANLNITIGTQEFSGSLSSKTLTLHTNSLTLDTLLNDEYFENFELNEFLSNAPILVPFDLPINISLSAQQLVYKNNAYQNFIYALKPDSQTFSITDSMRGNLLATIERDKTTYDIFIQLNRFSINGKLLSTHMPLNIRDTTLTGQIILNTYGQIAHDIIYNLSGMLDITFNSGYLVGLSIDNFFASAENITTLNAEYALSEALTSGETRLKQMRLIGEYSNNKFITTAPIELSLRHTDAVGGLAITDGLMTAEFDLTLRGTAPTPTTIQLSILPDGTRKYSLSEIMQNLDTSYMRAFIKMHDKF